MRIIMLVLLSFPVSAAFSQYLVSGGQSIDFTAHTEDGKDFKLSNQLGKYVLLEFTATHCGPCWESYPHLKQLQEKFDDNLVVVALHEDTLKTSWKKRATALNIVVNWSSLWNIENKKSVFSEYKINGWPVFYLIDPQGKIVHSFFGYKRKRLDKLLEKHITR